LSFLKQIRLKIGYYFLSRRAKKVKRNKQLIKYSNIRNLTLLFEINEPVTPKAVKYLNEILLLEKEWINQVVFYTGDLKKLKMPNQEGRIVFTERDCNFFYKPKKKILKQFNSYDMDYLVDLSMNESFPLIYLAGVSAAKLRIGKQSPARIPFFDLMIDQHTDNQEEFVRQLLHYIKNMPDSCYII
jgi:hypothetical protein